MDTGTGIKAIDPSDLNYPSIAIGDLFGKQTVTRTVTATTAGTYRSRVDLPGIKATVSPPVLHFTHPGQKRTFTHPGRDLRARGTRRHRGPHLDLWPHHRPQPDRRHPADRPRPRRD
ncbi:hypothetical protein ACFQ60_02435 [Streptomyces zhihengii]